MGYNIDAIVRHCVINNINISPQERYNWVSFCWAIKVRGYDESTFVALSNPGEEKLARTVWKKERNPHRYTDFDKAGGKIVELAREAGVDVEKFPMSHTDQWSGKPPSRKLPPLPKKTVNSVNSASAASVEYVDPELVEQSAVQVEKSALYIFLCGRFPSDDVRRVFADYRIGASRAFSEFWPGALASAFPLINAAGQIVDVHLMAYDEGGHRRKCEEMWKCQNWLLAKMKKKDRRAPWPLFGEHLTALRPSAPVGVVESEKTALIASLVAPTYVWCATLSIVNLNPERLAAVKEREIYLFPDRDGVEDWSRKAAGLKAAGFKRIHLCSEYILTNARNEKDDLGDIILDSL